ncbi:plant cysteine oxidase 1-like [Diospyros lotus]|uniref:plant cysteine oxidase 1-like n=1 Tax=Diospyros lotus TaxID=55363 RepID=UPI00225B9738|nr:plant cysteine oxidase 1-like [Diospyros lotus]
MLEHRRDTVGYVHKIVRKKKFKRKMKRRTPDGSVTLQRLYMSCREVFKGPGTVPSPADVQKLCHILDGVVPEDFGLSRDLQFFQTKAAVKGHPRVAEATIYSCKNFSLCLFFLPASGVIPLHNHPGMTVFSKLLLGTMHIKAYDWADPLSSDLAESTSKPNLARLKADSIFTAPCNSSVLYPTSGGNIHEFTAITPCAVLDVLGPPYSGEDGRDCSFYRDTPCLDLPNGGERTMAKEEGERYGWLEEIEMPEEARMDSIPYLGPQIIETGR